MDETHQRMKDKLWTKHFILMLIMSLFLSIIFNMQMSTIPMYTLKVGGNNSTIGIVTAIFTFSSLLFRPWFGNLLDTMGRKLVLFSGIILLSISSLSYSVAFTVEILFAIRIIHGIGFSAQSTATGTIISDVVPISRLGEGMSYTGIANTIATAIGPVMGLYIAKNYSYTALFILCFVFGVLGFLIAVLIKYESKIETDKNSKRRRKSSRTFMFERTAIKPSLVLFFMMLTIASVFTFVPSYAASRGIKDIGLFFTVYALAFLVTRLITGKLSDRYGASKVIIPGMLLMILSLVILAFATSLPIFLLAGVVYGLGFSSAQPTLNVVMLTLCPVDRRGAANATFLSAMDVGIGLGSIVWGIVSQSIGFSYVYLGSALCGILSLTIYMCLLHNKQERSVNDTFELV